MRFRGRINFWAFASEHAADAAHPEWRELGCTQRAHACGPEDVNSLRERPEDFLMPDTGRRLELTVDNADGLGSGLCNPIHITLGCRCQISGR